MWDHNCQHKKEKNAKRLRLGMGEVLVQFQVAEFNRSLTDFGKKAVSGSIQRLPFEATGTGMCPIRLLALRRETNKGF